MTSLKSPGYWVACLIGTVILVPTLWYYLGGDQFIYAYVAWVWQLKGKPVYMGELPGTYIMHYLIFRAFGPHPFSIRLADFLIQVFNLAMIVHLARKISTEELRGMSGIIASLLYASYYMGLAPENTVLRDGLALTPLLLAGLIFLSGAGKWEWLKVCLVGALVGAAIVVKPTFALAAPVFALFWLARRYSAKASWPKIIGLEALLLAFSTLPVIWSLHAMIKWGVYDRFLEVFRDYNRQYYLVMGGGYLSSVRYFDFVAFVLFHGNQVLWLGMAMFVIMHISRESRTDPESNGAKSLVFALLLVSLASMFIQAKGLEYHAIPIAGFAAVLAGFAFARIAAVISGKSGAIARTAVNLLLLVSLLALQVSGTGFNHMVFIKRNLFKPLQVAYANFSGDIELSRYIEERTRPEDKVLCFGFNMGVHLLANRLAPTPLFYALPLAKPRPDNSFAPVQIKWQQELVSDLKRDPPRYFLVYAPCICGSEDEIDFLKLIDKIPDLQKFLDQNYQLDRIMGYNRVYRLKTSP